MAPKLSSIALVLAVVDAAPPSTECNPFSLSTSFSWVVSKIPVNTGLGCPLANKPTS